MKDAFAVLKRPDRGSGHYRSFLELSFNHGSASIQFGDHKKKQVSEPILESSSDNEIKSFRQSRYSRDVLACNSVTDLEGELLIVEEVVVDEGVELCRRRVSTTALRRLKQIKTKLIIIKAKAVARVGES